MFYYFCIFLPKFMCVYLFYRKSALIVRKYMPKFGLNRQKEFLFTNSLRFCAKALVSETDQCSGE